MNLMLPVNGLGMRFKKDDYLKPKPLINILGKPMIFWVLDNLNIDDDINLFIIYDANLDEYNFVDLLNHNFRDISIKFIPVKHKTQGPAETVLYGLNNINNEFLNEPFMLIDCDTIYFDDIITKYKSLGYGNKIFYFKDYSDKAIYSYIKLNKDRMVTDIKEKEKLSDNANVGCYCFKNGKILKDYAEKLIISNDKEKGEFYVSGIYKKMLNDLHLVEGVEIEDFNCVGTPIQLKTFASMNSDKAEKKRVCFDLDNTLVSYPQEKGDYTTVKPIHNIINFAKFLKSMGHTIIIYTARRMRTHKGNIGKLTADIGKITLDTIKEFDIPCDELYFGKPYAHFYVDDLSVDPAKPVEKQVGFYNSDIETRDFNSIDYDENMVIKEGNVMGEIYYYNSIPKQLKKFFPKVYKSTSNKLVLEKIEGITFSYLYVNNSLTGDNIHNLLSTLDIIHNYTKKDNFTNLNIYDNYRNKIVKRFNNYDYDKIVNDYSIFPKLCSLLSEYENKDKGKVGIIHGDPVFTNVILEKDLKFVDVRGKLGEQYTIYGDIFYDYAKIYQSLRGYDFILYDMDYRNIYTEKMIDEFEDFIINKWDRERLNDIKIITSSLLFSLIPLHDNVRCERFHELAKRIIEEA